MSSIVNIELTHTFKGHRGSVYTLCSDEDSKILFSGGSDGHISRWQLHGSGDGESIGFMDDRIFCLQYAQNTKTIYAGSMFGDLYSLNLDGSSAVRRFRFHSQAIYRLEIWKDFLITIGGDGIVSLWNRLDGQWMKHLKLSPVKLRSLTWDETNNLAFIGDGNGKLFVIKLPELTILNEASNAHEKTIFSLRFLQEEQQLLSGGIDARLNQWDLQLQRIREIKAHWFAINEIKDLEGTAYFATASRDKCIRIWDKATMDLVKEISRPKFAAHSHSVNSLCWIKKFQLLFSGGDDGMIYGWHLKF